MVRADFDLLDNFNWYEVTNTGTKLKDVHSQVLWTLQALRDILGEPIKITCLSTGKHASNSYHYVIPGKRLCQAVDFKVLGRVPKNKVLQLMCDVGFTGIGVYHGFYHGDLRPDHKFWKRVKGVYLPLV